MAKETIRPVQLIFLSSPQVRQALNKMKVPEQDPVNLQDLIQWLGNYNLDSVELSVQSVINGGGMINLFISSDGQAGCKVILKLTQQDKASNLTASTPMST